MTFDNNKFGSLDSTNVNNFNDYDLDYLRMQIRKNSESLERAIENLRKLASKAESESQKVEN